MLKRLILLFSFIGIVIVLWGCSDNGEPAKKLVRPVKVMTIKKSETQIERIFPGKVLASKEAELSFLVPGKLIELLYLEGQSVKKRQKLAALDAVKYQEAVNQANANYIRTKSHYERAKVLVEKKFLSEAEFDDKKAAYLTAKAKLNSAKKDLSETVLYAPFSGVISVKHVDNYEQVKAKQPIYKLQNLSYVDIEINVPENVMAHIRSDDKDKSKKDSDKVVVIFDFFPDKSYPVDLKEYSSQADPETQTYRVVLKMPAPKDVNILPGMTANVKTMLPDFKSGGEAFIVIPSSAVFSNKEKQSYVWLLDPNSMTVKKHAIKVSRMADSNIHVLSGLKPGDKIVTAGVHFLQEGEKVSILEEPKE